MVPSSKSGAEIMHLCCRKRGHDYLNLWLTWGDSVSCSGSAYPRWHSSVWNDAECGSECTCKVLLWHSSALAGSGLSAAAAAALERWSPANRREVVTVGWGRYLWMISCKGLGTHQQVLFLTLTVLIGGVQHLEGQAPVWWCWLWRNPT